VNEFLSLRNNNRPKTQKDVDELMANEPDVLPAYGGAGSMLTHLARSKRQYTPTSSRARLTEAERKQFAAENQEPIYTTPEERVVIEAKVAEALNRHDVKQRFANAVRKNQPLADLWSKAGGDGDLLEGFERDGDPTGAPEAQIITAWKTFAESPIFAAYYTTDKASPRYKVLGKVLDLLHVFMAVNLINMTLASSWAKSFGLLNGIGVLPAPVPTEAQLRNADAARPASDGNPVVLHDIGPKKGQPVTYVSKDGKTIRYSARMLEQLTSRGFEMVMGFTRVDPNAPRAVAVAKTNDAGTPMGEGDYRNRVVGNTGMTQAELDQLPSEEYRKIMGLSYAPRTMQPVKGL
jgi:hypothetical protein